MKYLLTGFTACLFFLVAVTSLSAQNKNSVQGDLEALTDLYIATTGDSWSNNSGWLNGNPSNKWYGVKVDRNGRVIRLDLYKNNLKGKLPKSIGNLSKLQFFSVKRNPIYSRIPQSIVNWVQAKTVMFSSGSDYNLPREGSYNNHLGKKYIHSVAKYHGAIPDVFDKMPNLEILEIAWSENFDGQPFPSTLYQHSKLKVLVLQAVKLTGTLNDSFDLPNLKLLVLGNNFLSGELPPTLGQSTELVKLFFSHSNWFYKNHATNFFTGSIPASFTNLVKLQRFLIGNQNLGGEIPGFVIENWSLREFKIANNNFTGEIPKEFGDRNLVIFDVSSNNFTGKLHSRLVSGMQNVIIFNVSRNNLSGEIPNGEMIDGEFKGWRTKTGLRSVYFNANNFSGRLPDMPEYVGDMSHLFFRHNNFTGSIPGTWKELFTPALRDENPKRVFNNFNLRDNDLQGVIPSWFTSENGPTYDIGGNQWSHRDILENGVDVGLNYLEYSTNAPKPFGKAVSQQIPEGGQFSYDYSHKVHSSDKVQWTKNGILIPGATSPVFTIESVSSSDEGLYRLELTNNNGVSYSGTSTVVSMPIELKIGGSDRSGSDDNSVNSFPNAPVLYGPDDHGENVSLSPAFTWSDNESDYYILNVHRQNPSGMTIEVIVNATTFTPDEIFDDNTVHNWRVRGVKDGEEGEWSDIQWFTTREENLPDVADLVAPVHTAQNIDPKTELFWEDVGADSYEIRILEKKTSDILFSDALPDTSYMPNEVLPDTTDVVWQVRSIADGGYGAWGPRWEFSTGIYRNDTPILISPEQGSTYNNLIPTFEWESVDADRYVIIITRVDPTSAKSLTVIQEETTGTVYTPEISLQPEVQYYWRVQGIKDSEEGVWSEMWDFTLTNPITQKALGIQSNEEKLQQPLETSLTQNYPNPFNPTTQIEFALSGAQKVSLKVYDMAGRQVALLVDEVMQAGHHTATFDASNLSSGIYIYRFISKSHQFSRKMTLIK